MAQSKWTIDATHSGIHFIVRHMVITKVRGSFKRVTGTLTLDEADLTNSSAEATIEAASIETGDPKRDEHLRSADFFDAEKFPNLTFASKAIAKHGDEYEVTGLLTLHGVTKEIALHTSFEGNAKDPWGNQRVAFSAKGHLNRSDFGLVYNPLLETGGALLSDKIEIELEVQAIKAAG